MVYTLVLEASAERIESSSLSLPTKGLTMKIKFIKTHWFRGMPFLWNTLHNSEGKNVKIFRFGPLLIRVEKDENTKT